ARTDRQRRRREYNRIAIRGLFGAELGADVAARAGPVFRHDRLIELHGESLPDDAAEYVGGPAGRKRQDEPHGLCWVTLRGCRRRHANRDERARAEEYFIVHDATPMIVVLTRAAA